MPWFQLREYRLEGGEVAVTADRSLEKAREGELLVFGKIERHNPVIQAARAGCDEPEKVR